MEWYGVRSLSRAEYGYEERVVLFQAENLEEALEKGERDAVEYAENLEKDDLGLYQAYWIPDAEIGEGSEVFSLVRASRLGPDRYINRYFSTGREYQQHSDIPLGRFRRISRAILRLVRRGSRNR